MGTVTCLDVLRSINAATKQGSPTIAIAPDGQVMSEIVSSELDVLRVEVDLSKVSNWYLDQSRSDVVTIKSGNAKKTA